MIKFQFPELPQVVCLFLGNALTGDGLGGNFSFQTGDKPENVRNYRARLAEYLEACGASSWAECRQIHKDGIIAEPAVTDIFVSPEALPQADGLMTSRPNLALIIKTADCQPVLVAHKSGKFIMALHIGWRGNRIRFIQKAVQRFCEQYEIAAADIFACRGPSLGPMHSEFVNFAAEWGEEFKPWFSETSKRMNLWNLTRTQLLETGILPANIYEIDICTYENAHNWFSYRQNRETGRQASLIWRMNQGENSA